MGNPLRILHVVVNMNRGGAETLIMNLYRNIDRSKVQFDFLTCKEGVFDQEIIQMGGNVHRIPYISDVGHFQFLKELNQFFNTNSEYKIIHSHLDKMSGPVIRAAKRAKIPVRISHSHNTQSEGSVASKLYKWCAGLYIPIVATNFFACSNSAASWLFSKKSKLATILKNGIDQEQFAYSPEIRKLVREELKVDNDTFVLGHIGRFCHQKNHTFLLDIFSSFHKINKNSILLLVGDGPLRKDIEQKVLKMNLAANVKLLGIRSDVNQLLQAFDIFVFPSLHEGLPVSLIEAQGSGLPSLISDQISKEVDLGINLIDYASINDSKIWTEKINKIALDKMVRIIQPEVFEENGYDIKRTAYEIEDFYLNVSGENI